MIWPLTIGTLLTIIYGVNEASKPLRPDIGVKKTELLDNLNRQIGKWAMDMPPNRKQTIFFPLRHDSSGIVTESLRWTLLQTDRFDIQDYSPWEKAIRWAGWPLPEIGDRVEAVNKAAARKSELAIWGMIEEYSDYNNTGVLRGHLEVVDTKTHTVINSLPFNLTSANGDETTRPQTSAAITSLPSASTQGADLKGLLPPSENQQDIRAFLTRLLFWCVITLTLPLATYSISRKFARSESSMGLLLLFMSHILVSVVIGYLLLATSTTGCFKEIALLSIIGLSLAYYWHMFLFAQRSFR
jgi:hypothetical protein